MNFIMRLLKCKAYGQIYDAILIVIDQSFKKKHYILYSDEDERTVRTAAYIVLNRKTAYAVQCTSSPVNNAHQSDLLVL